LATLPYILTLGFPSQLHLKVDPMSEQLESCRHAHLCQPAYTTIGRA